MRDSDLLLHVAAIKLAFERRSVCALTTEIRDISFSKVSQPPVG